MSHRPRIIHGFSVNSNRARQRGVSLRLERLEERTVMASWVGQIGGADYDYTSSWRNTTDTGGNLYVAGQFSETVDFDWGDGVASLSSAGLGDGFVSKYTPDGGLIWARRFGGVENDNSRSIAYDDGSLYVAGLFIGGADFTGDGIIDATSAGQTDAYVLKLDAVTGATTWFKTFGGTSNDNAEDVAVADGFVYSVGAFRNSVDFNPGSGTFTLSAAGKGKSRLADGFVQKLDTAGNFQTAWRIGAADSDFVDSIVVDGSSLYLTGEFDGTVDFDLGAGTAKRTASGINTDRFLASYSTSGAYHWVDTFGPAAGHGWKVTSAGGDLVVTGAFAGTIDANPGAGTLTLNAGASSTDAFIGKYAKVDGALKWAHSYGAPDLPETAAAPSLVDGLTGNIYVGGTFSAAVDFNPLASGGELISAGMEDSFLLKLDTSGNFLNAWRMGGASTEGAPRLIGLSGTTIYAASWFDSTTADFPNGQTLTNAGFRDISIVAIDEASLTGSPLVAAGVPAHVVDSRLSADRLPTILREALDRWRVEGASIAGLNAIEVRVANLSGATLGFASADTIWLDDNAAGWGWFVDPTSWDDAEYTAPGDQGEQNRIDLLTVVMHELGHLLGYDHDEDGVMAETLAAGVRRTGLEHDATLTDQVFGQSSDTRATAWLGAWLTEQFDSAQGRAKRRR